MKASTTIYAAAIYPLSAVFNTNSLVTYSLSCASPGACGAFSTSNEVGATVYTAPVAIPSGGTVSITATSVADASISASATITITPPVPISVSFFSAVPASLAPGSSTQLRALIDNDVTSNPQVKWSVTCPSADCGSFNPNESYNEEPATYTAPAGIPTSGRVAVTVTSVTDPTKSASATIAILPAGPQLADGKYVFQIAGLDTLGNNFTTGVFSAAGGAIVGGEQDSIGSSQDGYFPQSSQITGGAYAPMPDGNLQIVLDVPSINSQPEILTGTLTNGRQGFVSGVQGLVGTGTLERQTSIAPPTGGYALLLGAGSFYDQAPTMAGILNIDGPGTISGKGSNIDIETFDGPAAMQLNASTVSSPDGYGRVGIGLNSTADSSLCPTDPSFCATGIIGYIVDAAHLRLILSDYPGSTYFNFQDLGGLALGQGEHTGAFSTASVAGSSYVFAAEGRDQTGVLQLAGVLNLNANGSVTGVLNWNDLSGGSGQAPEAFTGTYTVDATGRLTLSSLTDGANFNYSMRLDLDGKGGGFVLASDIDDQFTGQAFERQATAFGANTLNGRYGLSAGLYASPANAINSAPTLTGWLTSTASGASDSLSGYADFGNGAYNFALTGKFPADSSGVFLGQITGLDGILESRNQTASSTPNFFTLYLIDSTQGILIETDNAQLMLGRLQLAQ